MKRELPAGVVWGAVALAALALVGILVSAFAGGGTKPVDAETEAARIEYLQDSEAERDRNAGVAGAPGSAPQGQSEMSARGTD
jgi:hypothetical protein